MLWRKERGQCPLKSLDPSTAPMSSETATCPPATISKAMVNVKPQTDAS